MDPEIVTAQMDTAPVITTVPSQVKKKLPLVPITLAVALLLSTAYAYQQGFFVAKVTETPTPMVTPYVEAEIKLATVPTGLIAEASKEFTYQIVVVEELMQTNFSIVSENTTAKGATVSEKGLVMWTPSIDDIGAKKIEVRVSSGNRRGLFLLNLAVEAMKIPVLNKNEIPSAIILPQYPVFYVTEMKGKNQLWVMSRDGSQKKFTGVSGVTGLPHNIQNFGGVAYTVSDVKNSQNSEMAVYVFYTSAKQTVRIPVTANEKGLDPIMGNISLSPETDYLLYSVAFNDPKNTGMGYEMEKTFSYNFSTKKHTEIKDVISSDIVWGFTPGTIFKARADGIYSLNLDTQVYVKVDSIVDGIPNDFNLFQVNASTYVRLTGNTTTENRLLLRTNDMDAVIDTGEWADIQPFFCATPDDSLVLYERRVVLPAADPSMPQQGIRAIDVENKTKKDIHMNLKLGESYNIKGCYWTSASTVIIELFKDYTTRDLAQLNVLTGEITVLTTNGDISLSN